MTSPPSRSEQSRSFDRLDERIRRWVFESQWRELHDVQERAIPALLDADRDVIIAAATAAGKTEAAFLPILTRLLADGGDEGGGPGTVLYISPLKALINDQWARLADLCASLDIAVTAWHGDASASRKQKFLKNPTGVLIITPESLEALFVTRGASVGALFARLRYVVVDELHAFIGSERGKQLQSLLHRVDRVRATPAPRIGLSATLGDMRMAGRFLRPGAARLPTIIESKASGLSWKILLRGLVHIPPKIHLEPDLDDPQFEDGVPGSTLEIAGHLYRTLRGTNNLVFPNSRRQVEIYADLLRRACERDGHPNEFWPHHGSLSKALREEAEQALKEGARAASAICTTTLELGIDIGAVKSIAQIGAPPSVASLRQRLGRAGRRRGDAAILRGYCVEVEVHADVDFSVRLREGLVQSIAMVELLIRSWVEPPRIAGMHASTLVQQILSVIAERGGSTATQLWDTLVRTGPFDTITMADFSSILKNMGQLDLVIQAPGGVLLHGLTGERLVNHYAFYASFNSEDEYRLIAGGAHLGSLPVAQAITQGQAIIFGGRRWRVEEVDIEKKAIHVRPDVGGAPPHFDGLGAMVHDAVRGEMRKVLGSDHAIGFLDAGAQRLLAEGRRYYENAGLARNTLIPDGATVLLVTWCGDWINDALVLLLKAQDLDAGNEGVAIRVTVPNVGIVKTALSRIALLALPDAQRAVDAIQNIEQEKWDWALPPDVQRRSFASSRLDFAGAIAQAAKMAGR